MTNSCVTSNNQNNDYKERMVQEYRELRTRYAKIHNMLVKLDAGTLEFTPNCPPDVLKEQEDVMSKYMRILEVRAEIEDVNLYGITNVNVNDYKNTKPVDFTSTPVLPRYE